MADIDLTKYEREVVRSDQIQITIADGSEREFWKRGSLSYSFRLTPGEDFLFLESTHGDNRLMFANSWGGRGCQLIVKLKDPSFAIDGAIQNVGQAVTRPKDTVADEWVSRNYLASLGRIRFTWTWGDGFLCWYLNEKLIYKLPLRQEGLAGLGPTLCLYGMEVRDVKLSKKSFSPESVARLAKGEEPAEPVAFSTKKIVPANAFSVLKYEPNVGEAQSVGALHDIPRPDRNTSFFTDDGNVDGRWGVGQSLLCSKNIQFRFGDRATSVFLPTKQHYGIFGGSPMMRQISYGPVLIVPEQDYKLRWYRLLGGCTGDPGRDASQDEHAYEGSAVDVITSYDQGATVFGLNHSDLRHSRRFTLSPQVGTIYSTASPFKVVPRVTVAPLARGDNSLDSTILFQVQLTNTDSAKHQASATLTLRTHFARIDRNVNQKLNTAVALEGGRLTVTSDEGLCMTLIGSQSPQGFAANPVGEGALPTFYSEQADFGPQRGELPPTVPPVPQSAKDKILALQLDLGEITAGQSKTAYFVLVFADKRERLPAKAALFTTAPDCERGLADTQAFWAQDTLALRTPDKDINAAVRWYANTLRSCVYPTGILVTGRAGYVSESHYSQDLYYSFPGFAIDPHPLARFGIRGSVDLFFRQMLSFDEQNFGFAPPTANPLAHRGSLEKPLTRPIRVIPMLYYYWVYTGDERTVAQCLPYARRMVDEFLKAGRDDLWQAIQNSGGRETLSIYAQAVEGPWMMDRFAELVEHFCGDDEQAVGRARVYREQAENCRAKYNTLQSIQGHSVLDNEWVLSRDGNFAEGVYLGTFLEPMLHGAVQARPADGSFSTNWYWWDGSLARAYGVLADVDPRYIDGAERIARRMAHAMVGPNTICSPGEYLDEDNSQHTAVGGIGAYAVPAAFFRFSEQIAGIGINPRLPSSWPSMELRNLTYQGMKYDVTVRRADAARYVRPAEVKVAGKHWASLVLPRGGATPCRVDVAMTGAGQPFLLRTGGLTTEILGAERDGRSLVLSLQGKPSKFARERIVIYTAGLPVEAVSGAEVVLYSRINQELTLALDYTQPRHRVKIEFGTGSQSP